VEKQKGQLVAMHKDGCPWKTRQCDGAYGSQRLDGFNLIRLDSVYRLPVQSPSVTAKEIKSRAFDLQPVLEQVQVKHPLVSILRSVHNVEGMLTSYVVGHTGALSDVCSEHIQCSTGCCDNVDRIGRNLA
jgi:hypothetical protein